MRKWRWMLLPAAAAVFLAVGIIFSRNRVIRDIPPKDSVNPARMDVQYAKPDEPGGSAPPGYRWPAEFERQDAVWLLWPSEVYSQKSEPVVPSFLEIVKALEPHVRVNVAASGAGEIDAIRARLKEAGYTGTNAHFYDIAHFSIWARDVGPIFIRDGQNRLNIVDFRFNNYSRGGSPGYIETENEAHRLIADTLGYPLVRTDLVSEGGAIESNGRGTMLATEAVALKRNPGMTLRQIEDEYKRVLGVKKVIWLKNGLAEDDAITTGHINEFCRFADASTVLLAQVLPGDRYASDFSQESYRRMEENYGVLANATDQDGNPFRIIRVPMPPTLYAEADASGKAPLRSYLNYAATNGAVLMQTYWKPGRSDALKAAEDGVRETLRGVFPGREVIGIDAEGINAWGGGIHCVTQHVPAQ